MATSTLAPVTSFLPFEADCTCMMARWITRWKPSVGCVSTSPVPGTVGVLSPIKLVRVLRRSSILTAQARNTSAADGLSSSASSKCSTVMNSCRACRASTNAMCKLTSNSCAIILPPSRTAGGGLPCAHALKRTRLGTGYIFGKHAAHSFAVAMHTEHNLCGGFAVFVEIFLDDGDHEFHRGVVIIQQRHLVQRWRLQRLPLQEGFGIMLGCHTLIF